MVRNPKSLRPSRGQLIGGHYRRPTSSVPRWVEVFAFAVVSASMFSAAFYILPRRFRSHSPPPLNGGLRYPTFRFLRCSPKHWVSYHSMLCAPGCFCLNSVRGFCPKGREGPFSKFSVSAPALPVFDVTFARFYRYGNQKEFKTI